MLSDERSIARWGLSRTSDDRVTEAFVLAAEKFYVEFDNDGAYSVLDRANKYEPSEELYRLRAFWSDGRDDPLALFSQVIYRAPQWAIGYLDRAKYYQAIHMLEAAEGDATSAIERDPALVHAYMIRAFARTHLDKHQGALEDFERASELGSPRPICSMVKVVCS
jgi:tetratricopeptide (TPR) repeat protein